MENELNKINIANSKIKTLQNYLKENKIDLNKLSLCFKYSEIMDMNKYNNLGESEIKEIYNNNKFDPKEISFYKELFKLTSEYIIKNGEKCKINLIPKLKKGDEYIPFTALEMMSKKEEFLEQKNCYKVIYLNSFENETFLSDMETSSMNKSFSKISTAIMKIKKKFEEDDIANRIFFSNVFIDEHIVNLYKYRAKLKTFDFFNKFNMSNYFISNEKLNEIIAYEFYNFEKEYFIIVDDKQVIRHLGPIEGHDQSLEDKIFEIVEKKEEIINKTKSKKY